MQILSTIYNKLATNACIIEKESTMHHLGNLAFGYIVVSLGLFLILALIWTGVEKFN